MTTVHSLFAPSATERLLTCPGSYGSALRAGDGARRASVFSAEGTLAHLIAETKLRTEMGDDYFLGRDFEVDGHIFTVDRDFLDAVNVYVTHVENLHAVGMTIRLEQQVDLPLGFPIALFGTADCVAYDSEGITIVDLKFGRGKQVDPERNPQLMYYAAGVLLLPYLRGKYSRSTPMRLVIVQPRIPHADGLIHGWNTTAGEIADWLEKDLKPGVARALADDGATLVPGAYCQFCPAFKTCAAPHALAADVARRMFDALPGDDIPADPDLPDPLFGANKGVTDNRLLEIINAGLVIEPLLDEARAMVKERIAAGAVFPGWEVIQRKGKREWDVAQSIVLAALGPVEQWDVLTLKTPAAVEHDTPNLYRILSPLVVQSPPTAVLQQEGRTRRPGTRQISQP